MIVDWLKDIRWQVRAGDARAVQMQVAQHLKSFQIQPRDGAHYQGHVAHAKVGRLELTLVSYGAEVAIDAGQLGQFSILQWPLVGSYVLHVADRKTVITTNIAHLIPPGVPVRMVFSPDCLLLVVRMSAQGARALGGEIDSANLLEQGAAEALGLPIHLSSGPGATLKRTLRYLTQESFAGSMLTGQRALGRMAEDLYLAALKEALMAPQGARVTPGKSRPVAPRYVARAEAFLLQNLAERITLKDTAQAAGVSASMLSQAFRRHHALAPMAWWRTKRLDRAFEDLSRAGPKGYSVTDVGLAWGFGHLGRFSSAYARRFGESPRQTLQRSKSCLP